MENGVKLWDMGKPETATVAYCIRADNLKKTSPDLVRYFIVLSMKRKHSCMLAYYDMILNPK